MCKNVHVKRKRKTLCTLKNQKQKMKNKKKTEGEICFEQNQNCLTLKKPFSKLCFLGSLF